MDWTGKYFFLLACFANMVILLNLVIAIIGDVFATVNSMRLQCYYQERAKLIAETWDIYEGFEPKDV